MTSAPNELTRSAIEDSGVAFLEKPFPVDALSKLAGSLVKRNARAELRGISLQAFVQLLNHEQKTVVVELTAAKRQGVLYFVSGQLADAEVGSLKGITAALVLLGWSDAAIKLRSGVQLRPPKIDARLDHLLLESARLRDEGQVPDPFETDFGTLRPSGVTSTSGLTRGSGILGASGTLISPNTPRPEPAPTPSVDAVVPLAAAPTPLPEEQQHEPPMPLPPTSRPEPPRPEAEAVGLARQQLEAMLGREPTARHATLKPGAQPVLNEGMTSAPSTVQNTLSVWLSWWVKSSASSV